jgi:HTH-type transcriptional regulator/antitoxin HigA
MFKLIKNEEQYEEYLIIAESLIDLDPEPGSREGDELELLTLLIEKYEDEHYPIDFPDPIEAIKFRMEHQGITQKELASFIGTPSKVSEVLNRKRPLTLKMIRALNKHLDIPAEILLGQEGKSLPKDFADIRWEKFPITEMINKNYFKFFHGTISEAKAMAEELIRPLIENAKPLIVTAPLYRQHIRSGSEIDWYALLAWHAKVLSETKNISMNIQYSQKTINEKLLKELVSLSVYDEGPKLAQEFLHRNGIFLIIEPNLSHTHIDGSTLWIKPDNPVIALTIRYDRLDNFWFTLLHEIAHLKLHFDKSDYISFVDNLDFKSKEQIELEADTFAKQALIPKQCWNNDLLDNYNSDVIVEFSKKVGVHYAIVAGRIRWENNNYKLLSNWVGYRQVRNLFLN